MMTGLSWDTANFQAYSAFFGVGFTTREAELVVNHPIRRRIIRDLIFAGNVGLTSAVATLIVTFVEAKGTEATLTKIGLMVGGVLCLLLVWRLKLLKRLTDSVIRASLKRAGVVRALDYDTLLHMESGYCVSEIDILPQSPLAGKTLRDSRPADRGIIVLGVTGEDGTFRGAPGPDEMLLAGEVATVYGCEGDIRALSQEGKPGE